MVYNQTANYNKYLRQFLTYPDLPYLLDHIVVPSSVMFLWNRMVLLAKGYRWQDCKEIEQNGCDLNTREVFIQKYDLNHLQVIRTEEEEEGDNDDEEEVYGKSRSSGILRSLFYLQEKPVNECYVISTVHDWLDDVSSCASSLDLEREREHENAIEFAGDSLGLMNEDSDNSDIVYRLPTNSVSSTSSYEFTIHSRPRPRPVYRQPWAEEEDQEMGELRSSCAGSQDEGVVVARRKRTNSLVLLPEPIHSGMRHTYLSSTSSRSGESNAADIRSSVLNTGNRRRMQGLA